MNYDKEEMLLYALEATYNARNIDEYRNVLKQKIMEVHKWHMRHLDN